MSLINIVFSIPAPRFTEEQQSMFSQYGQWTIINERNGRLLIDAIGDEANLQTALDGLNGMGRTPHMVGKWGFNGDRKQDQALDPDHWKALAPDEIDNSDPENPQYNRPTEFKQVHKWAGWPDRILI